MVMTMMFVVVMLLVLKGCEGEMAMYSLFFRKVLQCKNPKTILLSSDGVRASRPTDKVGTQDRKW